MGKHQKRNSRVIDRAFARLCGDEERAVRDGMVRMLDAGLRKVMDSHSEWMRHRNEGDTLGWALVHDGTVVRTASQAEGGSTPRGDVLRRLEKEVARLPKTGWCGIVMSDMANDWYRVDWEMGFLSFSADHIAYHFHDYFKPLK